VARFNQIIVQQPLILHAVEPGSILTRLVNALTIHYGPTITNVVDPALVIGETLIILERELAVFSSAYVERHLLNCVLQFESLLLAF
jgi:hypothetical protein